MPRQLTVTALHPSGCEAGMTASSKHAADCKRIAKPLAEWAAPIEF